MPGGWRSAGHVALVALACVVTGCITDAPVAASGPGDCHRADLRPERPPEDEQVDRPNYTAMDAAWFWVQPGVFCQVVDHPPGCGFEVVEYWSGHDGFRIPDDPYRDYRSIVGVAYDDGGPGMPFFMERAGAGIWVLWGNDIESHADLGRGMWEAPDMERFLHGVTKFSDEQVQAWIEAPHPPLWEDPAWNRSSAEATGIPAAEPPPDLFRVRELYAEVTGGKPEPPMDHDFRDDTEVYGPWSFVFHEDSVTVHRQAGPVFEEVVASPMDEVSYRRASHANLDNATLRREVRDAFVCLGSTAPDLDGVELVHMALPIPHDG